MAFPRREIDACEEELNDGSWSMPASQSEPGNDNLLSVGKKIAGLSITLLTGVVARERCSRRFGAFELEDDCTFRHRSLDCGSPREPVALTSFPMDNLDDASDTESVRGGLNPHYLSDVKSHYASSVCSSVGGQSRSPNVKLKPRMVDAGNGPVDDNDQKVKMLDKGCSPCAPAFVLSETGRGWRPNWFADDVLMPNAESYLKTAKHSVVEGTRKQLQRFKLESKDVCLEYTEEKEEEEGKGEDDDSVWNLVRRYFWGGSSLETLR